MTHSAFFRLPLALALLASAALPVCAQTSVVVKPVTVQATTTFTWTGQMTAANLANASEFSPAESSQIITGAPVPSPWPPGAETRPAGYWASGFVGWGNDAGAWPKIILDLGATYDITAIVLWNGATSDGYWTSAKNVDVYKKTAYDLTLPASGAVPVVFSPVPVPNAANAPQVVAVNLPATRYVLLHCKDSFANWYQGHVEMREIRFISSNSGPAAPPTVQTQPLQQAVREGDAVSFSVQALGTQPFTYQWQREVAGVFTNLSDGPGLTGATGRVLTLASATPGDALRYRVTVTNALGSAVSNPAALAVTPALTPTVRITEIMPKNTHTLSDEDGAWSDWIELHNASAVAVDLGGWRLTDDPALPAKWTFPAGATLAPGAYRVVFASAKDRTNPAANLHTNFRLENAGGYLALLNPAGVVVSGFAPAYPSLAADQSYGLGPVNLTQSTSVLGSGGSLKYHIPTAAVSDAWRGGSAFDDGAWTAGRMDVGFGANPGSGVAAISLPGPTAGTRSDPGTLGVDFDVLEPTEITELGCFDDAGDGFAAATVITVKLWSRNQNGTPDNTADDTGATELNTLTFTSAAPGTLSGGHRFKALATPRSLAPGAYTITAFGYSTVERNGAGLPALLEPNGGMIRFASKTRYGAATLFPATPDDRPSAECGAGTFRFRSPGGVHRTSLAAMQNQNASAFLRIPFTVPAGAAWQGLQLSVNYDDGFVAWINGVPVASRNAPASPAYNSTATAAASATETIILPGAALAALQPGQPNILAVQMLNVSAADADARFQASLTADVPALVLTRQTLPTPGAANAAAALAASVVINEIHSDPLDSKSQFVEFIELYNPTAAAIDVSGWRLSSGVDFTLPAGTVMAAGGYLVVAENPAHLLSYLGYSGALGPWTGSLKNDGETINLQKPVAGAFETVHSVPYELGGAWPTVGDDPGRSLQLIHAGLDATLGGSWRSARPTPGARNTTAAAIAPPAIRQVTHTPAAPTSGQEVIVTAKVSDPDGVLDVRLEYQIVAPGAHVRLSDPAWQTVWNRVAMRDDGTAGDAAARDSIYSVTLPGALQQHRQLLRYRIIARDTQLSQTTSPHGDDPSANFAYFCYDGVPAWTAAVQPGVTAATTFPAATMGKIRPWHLLANPTDVQDCQTNPAYNDGVYRFEGTLVADGVVYDHVFYRVKGQYSTYNTGKNKWKFQFNTGRLLQMPDDYGLTQTTIGTLNLSSVIAPWLPFNRGLAGLDEAAFMRLSNLAGCPAPRSRFVNWRVIDAAAEAPASQFDGDFYGLYLAFENTDNRFKDEHGLEDGNIFRMQNAYGPNNNHLLGQGKGQPSDLSDLNAFISTTTGYLKGTAGNLATIQPESWFRSSVHLPHYYTWRSIAEALNFSDRRDQENVTYFRSPAGLWEIYGWDVDNLCAQFDFWGPQGTVGATPYEQIQRALTHPALRIEFQNRARELQDLLLNADQGWKLMDEMLSLTTAETPRLIPNGGAINTGFVEADRRRWDYWPASPVQPRSTGATGNYYKSPYPITGFTGAPASRILATADFAGSVKWVKDFIATDNHGGARLALMASGVTDPQTLATGAPAVPIPATPVLTYTGAPAYPLTGLTFQSSVFSSPVGQAFAAMQWRVGEVAHPGITGFVPGQPWIYEIQSVWESAILNGFNASAQVPPATLASGRTYRARVRHQDAAGHWSHWSAPVEFTAGTPTVGDLTTNLVISEIMYNPVEGGTLEFIELRNTSATTALALDGVGFTSGVSWSYSGPATLAPGGTFVLAANAAAFQLKYGFAPNAVFTGSLNNAGERLTLSLGLNTILRDFTYDNAAPWPTAADGTGRSLVLIAPQRNPDHADPLNWRASTASGGNPGASDAVPFTGDPNADDDQDGWSNYQEYALGPNPALTLGVDALGHLTLTHTIAPAADDAEVILQVSEDLLTWRSGPPHTAHIAPDYWTILTPSPVPPRQFVRLLIRQR